MWASSSRVSIVGGEAFADFCKGLDLDFPPFLPPALRFPFAFFLNSGSSFNASSTRVNGCRLRRPCYTGGGVRSQGVNGRQDNDRQPRQRGGLIGCFGCGHELRRSITESQVKLLDARPRFSRALGSPGQPARNQRLASAPNCED